jgi:hemoglobin/transferrin/lactoferrin receptor protein
VARPGEKTKVSLNASTGFRAPNLDDAGKVFDSAPGIVVVPNPDLEPEYAWNVDLGIAKQFGNVLHADITGFYTLLTNAMIRNDYLFNGEDSVMYGGELSKVEAMTNAGSARVYGLQVTLQLSIARDLHLTSALNLTEGKESDGSYIRHTAPLFGSTHLVFERSRLKADLYSSYNGAKKYEKMPPSETEKAYLYAKDENGNPWSPGWVTLNFKLSYSFFNRLFLNAGVENILDLRYRPYSSGIAAAGRNFILSLRVTV